MKHLTTNTVPRFKVVFFQYYFQFIAIATFLALSAIKMRAYLNQGRFWAEEGAVFYRDLENSQALDGITYIFNGHLELITNLIVYASTFVGLESAPIVTTYASFVIQLIPIVFIIRYREALSLTRLNTIIVIIIAAGLPQTIEIWANSINLHFHFCLLAALIAAVNPNDGPPKWVSRLLLAIAGLSGIPSNFLVPVFAALAIKTRQTERLIQLLILSLSAALQISLLAFNHFESGPRNYFSSPLAFWLAPIAQSVTSPLFGFSTGEQLIHMLKGAFNLKGSSILLAIFLSIPLVHLLITAFRNNLNSTSTIIFSAFTLLFMNVFAAIGEKMDLVSVANGGRYFYAPNILFSIALLVSIKKYNALIAIAIFVLTINSLTNVKQYINGPDWESNFSTPREKENMTYNIWPTGWTMVLKSNKTP